VGCSTLYEDDAAYYADDERGPARYHPAPRPLPIRARVEPKRQGRASSILLNLSTIEVLRCIS